MWGLPYLNINEILTIINAEYIVFYVLRINFSNGQSRYFYFSTIYDSGVLQKLKDLNYFKNFTLDAFTIDWNKEIGFDPAFLLERGSLSASNLSL